MNLENKSFNGSFIDTNLPICIDLDGTLIKNDSTASLSIIVVKKKPISIIVALLHFIIFGRSGFKHKISIIGRKFFKIFESDFCIVLVEHLKELQKIGADIYLVTGADIRIAEEIECRALEKFGLKFKKVFGSNQKNNLISHNKAKFLKKKFPSGFIYYGNGNQDIAVFDKSLFIGVVNPTQRVAKYAKKNKHKIIFFH